MATDAEILEAAAKNAEYIQRLEVEIKQLQANNQLFRIIIGFALALENIEAIKGTLRHCP